jgi:transcriptional regulator with XRE-family HTH domain
MRQRMKYTMLRDNVEALRNRFGDTQERFADRLGVSQGTVSRWGQSIPRGDQIIALAMLAGVLPDDFLTKPLGTSPKGAYVTQPTLKRALLDALPELPEGAAKRAEYLAQVVLRAAQLPEGLRDDPANDQI